AAGRESGGGRTGKNQGAGRAHPLWGKRTQLAPPAGHHLWQTELGRRALPSLDDHRVQGTAVLPASAYLEMALAAAAEAFGTGPCAVKNIKFHRAFFLEDEGRAVQQNLAPAAGGGAAFSTNSPSGDAGRR